MKAQWLTVHQAPYLRLTMVVVGSHDVVSFTVNVTLIHCPDEQRNSGKKSFTIFVRPAFGRFTLEVGQCLCDCEQNPDTIIL